MSKIICKTKLVGKIVKPLSTPLRFEWRECRNCCGLGKSSWVLNYGCHISTSRFVLKIWDI